MMQAFLDEVQFNENGNQITMVKRRAEERSWHDCAYDIRIAKVGEKHWNSMTN